MSAVSVIWAIRPELARSGTAITSTKATTSATGGGSDPVEGHDDDPAQEDRRHVRKKEEQRSRGLPLGAGLERDADHGERWHERDRDRDTREAVGDVGADDPGYEFSPRLWVELAAAVPLLLPPGSAYHYSNIGYIVAGLAAERAGGGTLATLFRRQIISPLRLSASAYDPHGRIIGPHASGYRVASDGRLTDSRPPGRSGSAPTAGSSPTPATKPDS